MSSCHFSARLQPVAELPSLTSFARYEKEPQNILGCSCVCLASQHDCRATAFSPPSPIERWKRSCLLGRRQLDRSWMGHRAASFSRRKNGDSERLRYWPVEYCHCQVACKVTGLTTIKPARSRDKSSAQECVTGLPTIQPFNPLTLQLISCCSPRVADLVVDHYDKK